MPPEKAKHRVGSCSRAINEQPEVKCEAVAAVRLGRQQPGILSSQKLPRPLNELAFRFEWAKSRCKRDKPANLNLRLVLTPNLRLIRLWRGFEATFNGE